MYSVDASYSKRDQLEFQTRGRRCKLKKQRTNKKQRQMFPTFRAVKFLEYVNK